MVEEFFGEEEIAQLKKAVIIGAAQALKQKSLGKSDEEALQHVTDNSENIIKEKIGRAHV